MTCSSWRNSAAGLWSVSIAITGSAAPEFVVPHSIRCWQMPAAATFDVVAVWACDRLARSTRHFLEVLDELNHLNLEFVSCREQLDTGGPLGRAVVIIISAIAELEHLGDS
jgi:hypothetical protein